MGSTTRRDPYLLHHVVELVAVPAEQTVKQHSEPRRVPLVQRAKWRLVAVEKAADKRGIGRLGRLPLGAHPISVGRLAEMVAPL
jgi:hypothetical protein